MAFMRNFELPAAIPASSKHDCYRHRIKTDSKAFHLLQKLLLIHPNKRITFQKIPCHGGRLCLIRSVNSSRRRTRTTRAKVSGNCNSRNSRLTWAYDWILHDHTCTDYQFLSAGSAAATSTIPITATASTGPSRNRSQFQQKGTQVWFMRTVREQYESTR